MIVAFGATQAVSWMTGSWDSNGRISGMPSNLGEEGRHSLELVVVEFEREGVGHVVPLP